MEMLIIKIDNCIEVIYDFDTMNKDVLAYILLDCAVGLYTSYKPLTAFNAFNICEWKYLSTVRLVCKEWKNVIDKYIFRYVNLKKQTYVNEIFYISTDVITIVNNNGQQYRCRFKKIIPHDIVIYSSFIFGSFDIDFKFGSNGKKTKRKASLNIRIKTDFNDAYHTHNTDFPQNVVYTWNDKHGSTIVEKGWKKMIGEHILKFILLKHKRLWR